jgi:hypothetical protein
MRGVQVTVPELAELVGTRAVLGAERGLLLADCLTESQRKAVGWTLLLVGAVTTVPLAFERSKRSAPRPRPGCQRDPCDRRFWSASDRNLEPKVIFRGSPPRRSIGPGTVETRRLAAAKDRRPRTTRAT